MHKQTILLLENNPDDVALLRLMFQRSGILNPLHVTETVHDTICYLKGEGVYQDREKHPVPVLLMLDVHLADGRGQDVLNWLKSNLANRRFPAVVLSGSDINRIRRFYELGAESFLVKPLRFEDFRNMVEHTRGIKLESTSDGQVLTAG